MTQFLLDTREHTQKAIDACKSYYMAYRDHGGEPWVVRIVELVPDDGSSKQQRRFYAMLGEVAKWTGIADLDAWKAFFFGKWFPPIVTDILGQHVERPAGWRDLSKRQRTMAIDLLDQWIAEEMHPPENPDDA